MQAVILAAGESSRFWPLNSKHKSLIKLQGKSLVLHTIEKLQKAGIENIITIQNPGKEFEKEFKIKGVKYVVQKKPQGTGNALWQAKSLIFGPFIVLGPHKIDLNNYLPVLLKAFGKNRKRPVLLGAKTIRPWDFGVVKFRGKKISGIVENPKKGKEPSQVKTFETYVFPADFFDFYGKTKKGEASLIDAINLIVGDRCAELVLVNKDPVSLKYPWDLLSAMKIKFQAKDFKNYVHRSAKIGKNVVLKKKVFIGEGVKIGDNTVITGPCHIGDGCEIGANNVLRGPVNLEREVKTGALCEIKNTIIQEGTHLHSGYFGDSIIGENCRFGAGFITANRRLDRQNIKCLVKGKLIDSGLTYLGIIVGNNTRFGIHCGTMPGKFVGSGCIIGPHSIIKDNIEDNVIFYSKFNGIEKQK